MYNVSLNSSLNVVINTIAEDLSCLKEREE